MIDLEQRIKELEERINVLELEREILLQHLASKREETDAVIENKNFKYMIVTEKAVTFYNE